MIFQLGLSAPDRKLVPALDTASAPPVTKAEKEKFSVRAMWRDARDRVRFDKPDKPEKK
jgi:hypothetical protein